jgi:hypothetical protein
MKILGDFHIPYFSGCQDGPANSCHRFSWSTSDFMEKLKRLPNFVFVHALLIHPSRSKFFKITSPCLLNHKLCLQKVKFTISQNTKFRESPLEALLLVIPSLRPPRYTQQKNLGTIQQNETPSPPKRSISRVFHNFPFFMLRKVQ